MYEAAKESIISDVEMSIETQESSPRSLKEVDTRHKAHPEKQRHKEPKNVIVKRVYSLRNLQKGVSS